MRRSIAMLLVLVTATLLTSGCASLGIGSTPQSESGLDLRAFVRKDVSSG
jgi:hypothetical protein